MDVDRLKPFAEWAADLASDDIPDDVLRLARAEIADTVAAAADGYAGDGCERTELLRRYAGAGDCSAFGVGGTDPASACFVNATCSMIYDFDDFLFMGHTDHSAVFAGLAVAELESESIEELAVSVVVANELEGRLGAAAAVGPHNGQMWTYIHQAGAAVIAARSLDGSARAIRNAAAAALFQLPWPTARGFMQGNAKFTTASVPTAAGFRLGLFAASGGRGADDMVEGDGGALEAYADLPVDEMLDGWGDSWVTRSLSFKPQPGCAYLQSALENLAELGATELEPGAIESIDVHASLPTIFMERLSAAYRSDPEEATYSTVNTTFSVRLGLATAVVGGGLDRRTLSRSFIDEHRQAIDDLADRISLSHDWDHTAALIEGVGAGIDLHALADCRSTFTWLRALRAVRNHHQYASLPSDLGTVPNLSQMRDLIGSVAADWDVDTFAFNLADFDRVRFDFGSRVSVETSAGTECEERPAYRGACREEVDDRVELVREKAADAADGVASELSNDEWIDAVLEGAGTDAVETLGRFVASTGQ